MIKHKLLLLVSLFSFTLMAQDDDVNLNDINNKKHEFRIDAIEGLAVPALDVSYEYVLSRYSGVGASINFLLESDNDFNQNFSFTPYYRQYFFNKKDYGARGFFAEGLIQYATGEGRLFDFNNNTEEDESWSQFGIGFAVGQKWVSRNGFVIELLAGGGRYFGGEDFAPDGFFRGGINIGYRF